jgi:hypothetical protein
MRDDPRRVASLDSRPQWPTAAAVALASLAFVGGLFVAWHHPLWPMAASAVFVLWAVIAARARGLWLLVLPAALPLLNFAPWTGWLLFDEFDLLVLGALAGEFARLASDLVVQPAPARAAGRSGAASAGTVLAIAFAALGVVAFLRGLADAGGGSVGWFDGYADGSNSLRLSKSLFYVAALWPVLQTELQRSSVRTLERLAHGMQIGLAYVGLVLLWERAAYPGLLDFSARYRTTATFWEMHVGGAAIDAYLAMATPFAAWALVAARSPRTWLAAATLALLTGHACLTTFSRGAYVGVALPLLLLGIGWWTGRLHSSPRVAALTAGGSMAFAFAAAGLLTAAFLALGYRGVGLALLALAGLILALRRRTTGMPWRRAGAMTLTVALLAEVVAVVGGGSFMRSRLDASEGDFGARLAHWRHGLGLLQSPADWLVGIGSGRLPARYAAEVRHGEFSGALALVTVAPNRHAARLSSPATVEDLAGLFSLTQRVSIHAGGAYRVNLRLRTTTPFDLAVDVCEQHLLYSRQCQGALIAVASQDGEWQSISASLSGPKLDPGPWYMPRLGVFSLSVRDTAASVEFASASLGAPDGTELLDNGDFSRALAHWLPTAQSYYLPWHIDNLYLELLIEHGVTGLMTFVLLLAVAFSNLLSTPRARGDVAPFLAASLLGALVVGSVSSVLDAPRISFLLLLTIAAALLSGQGTGRGRVRMPIHPLN